MKKRLLTAAVALLAYSAASAQDIFPGADEKTPSRAQYFSWINNTNEGPTEAQTMINLDFFEWLHDEYGMILDIYAFDAGIVDGKNFYGSTKSDRFYKLFPTGLDNVYEKAKGIGTRFGIWGGPDGFGDTEESAQKRIDEFVELCEKYDWALYKFDAVCGKLRPEMEDTFIKFMVESRKHSPDLILLNHRLGLTKSLPYATTFLWNGGETYVDVHNANRTTASHNRVGLMSRGLVPDMKRLTEDHGVCLSSCLDFWDDDLILQSFSRSLILAPEIYANPWLLADSEYPKLARIYNIHRNFGEILVNGMELPESYGLYPVARGDENVRFITLRNLSWEDKEFTINLNEEIGLKGNKNAVSVRLFHPYEKMLGDFKYGSSTTVTVEPFRALLLMVTNDPVAKEKEPYIEGAAFEVIKNVAGEPVEIALLGMPGERATITVPSSAQGVVIDGKPVKSGKHKVQFAGSPLTQPYNRFICDLDKIQVTKDANALYEATVFAADNNALEVRSVERSGETKVEQVKNARDAFFTQAAFVGRGLWDKFLFDGDMSTGFWPTRRHAANPYLPSPCFRLDLGELMEVDSIVFKMENNFALEPILLDEGNFALLSSDLVSWESVTYLSGLSMSIPVDKSIRYLKLARFPQAIAEIEVYNDGKKLPSESFRASNLFSNSSAKKAVAMWSQTVTFDEVAKGSYLSVAINGKHGIEGAYAAMKVDGEYVGAPSRAVSYPTNSWESPAIKRDNNYTYYIPVDESIVGKEVEIFVMCYDSENTNIDPKVWISTNPIPFERIPMTYKK